ncbi:MAG: hypothetical protein KF862_12765 [Chitinophagaceae bacterium]|nr:hypothetical protein [Chitinophagaceae bacterium]
MYNERETIQSLWIGDELSTLERLCIESFIQNGHEFHLYCYDYVKNVPRATVIADANKIVPHCELFKDSRGGYASFSDYFRYKLLYEKGNCWTDMDMICINPILLEKKYCFITEMQPGNNISPTNAFIKVPARSEILEDLLHCIAKIGFAQTQWGSFGPKLLAFVLKHYECREYVQLPDAFCPINYWDVKKLVDNNEHNLIAESTLAGKTIFVF